MIARRPCEIERDEAGDVGDREAVAREERPAGQRGVDLAMFSSALARFTSAHSAICGDLQDFGRGMGVTIGLRDREQQVELGLALPHLDFGALARAGPEQRGLGMQLLEIAADGDRFGDEVAVVEFERGHALERD